MAARSDPLVADPGIGLLAQSIRAVVGVFPFVLGTAVLAMIFSGYALDGTAAGVIATLAAILAEALLFHATCVYVLSEGAVRGLDILRQGRGNALLPVVGGYALLLLVIELPVALSAPATGDEASSYTTVAVFAALVHVAFLARYGTVFPAMIVSDDPALSAAAKRARFWPVLWRLLAAVLLPTVVLSLLMLALVFLSLPGGFGQSSGLGMLAELVISIVIAAVTVATAVILCNACRGVYR